MALVAQLKSRRVFRAIVGYGVVAFALLQIIEPIMHGLHLPEVTLTFALIGLAAAFPIVVAAAWLTGESETPVHVHPAWIAGALAAVLAAAAFLVVRRAKDAPRTPTLVQVTFEGGIEEYAAWSPDGNQIAYAAQSGPARKIFRKEFSTGKAEQLTQGDADDLHPSFSADGQTLAFMRSNQPGKKLQPGDVFGVFSGADVWQLDLRTGKERRLVANASNPDCGPDGHIVVDAAWAGPRRIWLIDANGENPQQVTTDTTEDVWHMAPRFSPDGRRIAFQVQQRTKFDISVVDLGTKEQSRITDDSALDVQPAWSRSGTFIYFTSDRGGGYNIWRAPARGGPLQQITTGAGQDVEAALSPDGRRLAFSTLRQNADLWRVPVDPRTGLATGAPEPVIATTREESRGAYSADGTAIAFNSDRGGAMNIWIRQDGADRRVTSGPGGDFQPSWSPDGRTIAFFSSRLGRPRIFTVDVASGAVAAVTPGAAIEVNPFYSPDGKWIAYQSDRTGRSEVWLVPANGGPERQLTRDGSSGHFIRWSGGSDAVVFNCPCGGQRAIMVVPLSGADPVKLTGIAGGAHISFSPDRTRIMDVVGHRALTVFDVKTGAGEKVLEFPDARIDYPVWSPDGKWVLFERNHPEGGDLWVMRDVE